MQRPSRTCVQNTSMTNRLPSQQSVRCDFYCYWHWEQILIHSVYWHPSPPFQIKAIRGRQTISATNIHTSFVAKTIHTILHSVKTLPVLLGQNSGIELLMIDYLQNWCGIKSIQYISLFFSGPIEQLPDYNRIRSGMYWMRTWELVLSLDT